MSNEKQALTDINDEMLIEELSDKEKFLRELFIGYYLDTYDPIKAALSCGFIPTLAEDIATSLLNEGYVQCRISELKHKISKNKDDLDLNRIRTMLFEQANYYGQGHSHSARVSALGKLAVVIKGIDPDDDDGDVKNLKIEFA